MLRKNVLLGCAIVLALGAQVQADPINLTELAQFNRAGEPTPGVGTPQVAIYSGAGGISNVNQYTGAPVAQGALFKVIAAVPISNVTTSAFNVPANTVQTATGDGANTNGQLIQIFAIQGHIVSNVGGLVTASLDNGVMRTFQVAGGTFSKTDLSTWGFGGTVFDEKLIKPFFNGASEAIAKGNVASNNTSVSGLGPGHADLITATVISGSNPSGTLLNINGTGPDMFFNRTQDGVLPGSTVKNGSAIDFQEVFQLSSDPTFNITANPNNLTVANNIFQSFSAEDGLLLDGGFQFATTFNNAADPKSYNPNLTGTGTNTGDFASSVIADTGTPTIEAEQNTIAVPEPASMVVWGLIAGGGCLYRVVRRRNRKAVA
jgi:hypothetical protein